MTYTHQSQYQPGSDLITRQAGCTWTSVANGIRATTAEAHKPTPDEIHDLVSRNEETAPTTPGWSLDDAALAASRYGMAFQDHTGEGWAAAIEAHANRHYVLLQGDSDQFGNATCSGAFNGDHCIGIYPKTKIEGGVTYWWIDDPICPEGRWERVSVLKAYAAKLWTKIRFGYFLQPVPPTGYRWVCKPTPPATVRKFYRYHLNSHGHIDGRTVHYSHGASPRCSRPRLFQGAVGHRDRTLVRIIEPGRPRTGWYVSARFAEAIP